MTLEDIVDLLNGAGIKYLIVGAHAAGILSNEPRATKDIDVLLATRDVRKATKVIATAFPDLELLDTPVVARFHDPKVGHVVLDLMKPNQHLFRVAMRHVQEIEQGGRVFPLPTIEFMLVMKFAAMIGPLRDEEKRHFDIGDLIRLVRTNPRINLTRLAKLGDRVYPGGGVELLDVVDKVRRGERIEF